MQNSIGWASLFVVMCLNSANAQETIVVRTNTPLTGISAGMADTRYTGFLHSLTPTSPGSIDFELLKPTSFRTGVLTNISGNVITGNFDTYDRVTAAGAKFEYVLSDYIYVKPANQITWPGSSAGPDPFSGWKADLDNRIAAAQAAGATAGRWDIWNEPDWPTFWPYQSNIVGRDRFFQAWKIAYDRVRTQLPNVKIVGPSLSMPNGASGQENGYPSTGKFITVSSFLDFAKANAAMPDVLTVHTFDKDVVTGRLSEVRTLLAGKGIKNLPIAVNEYVGEHEQTRPGVLPHYFAKLRAAGVDYAIHATWSEPSGSGTISNTYNASLDGLLTDDTKLPRSTWWVYKRYGEMTGTMVQVDAGASVNGLASVNATTDVATILIGRDFNDFGYQSTVPTTTPPLANLQLTGIVASMGIPLGTPLSVELQRIADRGYAAYTGPTSTFISTTAGSGPLTVSLPDFGWSDAYFIRVSAVPEPGCLFAVIFPVLLTTRGRKSRKSVSHEWHFPKL